MDVFRLGVVILLSVLFKLLLIPTYHSTDFEVHRNWLAITNSLPVSRWYYENTSEWTLDYPPFFAYFEYGLSLPAKYFDAEMLKVENLNYKSPQTINYQRLTVIISELTLVLALIKFLKFAAPSSQVSSKAETSQGNILGKEFYLIVQFLFNYGLIVVDNIHFQYNGFLFGIQLLSVYCLLNGNWLVGSFLFSSLINLKHIYLYVAPAYFFYIFFYYCLKSGSIVSTFIRLVKIGIVTIVPFILSFGPFVLMDQMPQVLSRLFPFKRGLCHAYWAPNAWSLYNFVDKVLSVLRKQSGSTSSSSTSGLVQDIEHVHLPSIKPVATFILSFLGMIVPIAIVLFNEYRKGNLSSQTQKQENKSKPSTSNRSKQEVFTNSRLVDFIVVCAFSSYLFGWHVHEKAILLVTIPLSLISTKSARHARIYYFLSLVSNYSLFPLLFRPQEYPIKSILFLILAVYNYLSLRHQFGREFRLRRLEVLYLSGIVVIEAYNNILQYQFNLDKRLPYLPLMFTSVFCSFGVLYSWIRYLALIFK